MSIKIIITIILFGLSGSLEAASTDIVLNKDRDRAIEAYRKNNFALAAQLLPPFAEQGDPESLYSLARMYENGWGVNKNLDKAKDYYLKSARAGYPAAKMLINKFYNEPEKKDLTKKIAPPTNIDLSMFDTSSQPISKKQTVEKKQNKKNELPFGTRVWLEKNPWFMKGENPEAATLAKKIDADLQNEGYSPDNPVMYAVLNRRLKYIMPNLELGEVYIPDHYKNDTVVSTYSSSVVTPPETVNVVPQVPKIQESAQTSIQNTQVIQKNPDPLSPEAQVHANEWQNNQAKNQGQLTEKITPIEVFFNICINLIIYLSIPLTIRYVILRHPIEKKWVAVVTLIPVFIIFSIFLSVQKKEAKEKIYQQAGFTYNGGASMIGSPMLIGAMVGSYFILIGGSRRKTATTPDKEPSSSTEEAEPSIVLPTTSESKLSKGFSMNDKQKTLLQVIAVIVVGMLLYPPFNIIGKNGIRVSAGYNWLFAPDRAVVDVGMLLAQWAGVLVVGALIYFSLKSEK